MRLVHAISALFMHFAVSTMLSRTTDSIHRVVNPAHSPSKPAANAPAVLTTL